MRDLLSRYVADIDVSASACLDIDLAHYRVGVRDRYLDLLLIAINIAGARRRDRHAYGLLARATKRS